MKEYLDPPEDGLMELRRIYRNNNNLNNADLVNISVWAAYFGDIDFALEAQEKALNIVALKTWTVWYPVMKEVRQLPRFKKFMLEIGLVDYWKEYGWSDLCHPINDDDFECE